MDIRLVDGQIGGTISASAGIVGELSATESIIGELSISAPWSGNVVITGDEVFSDPNNDGNIIITEVI